MRIVAMASGILIRALSRVRYGIKPKCNKLLDQVGVPTPRFGPFQAYRINPKCRAKYRNQLVLPIFLV